MDMTRRAVLMTSAAIAANVLRPELVFAQATPRKGGVFTVHYGAEQRQLNPSLQASTGVYIIGGKIQEALVDLDATGWSIRRLMCSAAAFGSAEVISMAMIREASLACFCNSGIHTVFRVRCWQAKMRIPPGLSASGQRNTLNLASPVPPPGRSTGRPK